jgi:dihydroneopterin aldolase
MAEADAILDISAVAELALEETGATTMVRVRDLPLSAVIGINPDELGRRQPLIVSVEMRLAADRVETLAQTIDYRRIAAEAERLAENHVTLIEIFARRLAERCLALGPALDVEVIVAKPQALVRGMASVSVRMGAPSAGYARALP